MKKFVLICGIASAIIGFVGCQRNAITGRNQLSIVSESEVQSLAAGQYKEFLDSNRVVGSANRDAQMVKRVGGRIIESIKTYYSQKGLNSELQGYKWEVNLVDNKEMNAWCMPGGKIVVYTGLLPVTLNEAGLAVVMGHEIAHALARHGSERMSQALLQQGLGLVVSTAVSQKPKQTQHIFNAAYGVGSGAGLSAFSRSNELEADRYGLMFSALAGFDPREAISFWQRMAKASNGGSIPSLFSTHPGDATRIAELEKVMDETLKKYYRKP